MTNVNFFIASVAKTRICCANPPHAHKVSCVVK